MATDRYALRSDENYPKPLYRILTTLTLILILAWSSFGLLGLLHPKHISAEEQQIRKYAYNDVNYRLLPNTIFFKLPSKQAIDTNGTLNEDNSFRQLLSRADSILSEEASSVMRKKQTPFSVDKHDFVSLSPYFWPNLTKSTGLPYIYRDSETNPEVDTIPDARSMHEMAKKVRILSVAYYLTDNASYASKASELLRIWFLDNETRMNPNLEHSEVKPGINNGSHSGIMSGIYLLDVPDAVELIHDSGAWSKQDQNGIELWFSRYLDWLLNSDFGMEERKSLNNHGTWYDVQVSSIALFLNKPEITREVIKNYTDKLIAAKIRPDGLQPNEVHRRVSFDYHLFNLQAFFNLAKIGYHIGIDLWNDTTPEGSGLQKELDYLLRYALGKEKWPYEQIRPVDKAKLLPVLCQAISHYEEDERYKQAYRSIDGPKVSAIDSIINGCITEPVDNK